MKIAKNLRLTLRKMLQIALGEVKTDKEALVFEGEELAVGFEVFVQGEGEELIAAPDGEYLAEDGRKIIVKDGVVAEIAEAEPEVEAEEEPAEPVAEPEENAEVVEEEPAAEPIEEEPIEPVASVEDRLAAIEERLAEYAGAFERIIAAIAGFEDRLAALEEKVAGLESEPAAEPAAEPEVEEEKQSKISYLRKINK